MRRLICAILVAGLAPGAIAQSGVVTIEGTRIEGDEELPALVFNLPWQQAQFPALSRQDERLMTRHESSLLERPVVRREIDLHRRLLELTTEQEPNTP